MAKHELSKSLEAAKLNKRTGIPLTEHPVTIPYGAILENLEEVGDYYRFTYHTERYQMKRDSARGALHVIAGQQESAKPVESTKETLPPGPTSIVEELVADDERPVLSFDRLRVIGGPALSRAKVPGGWLVASAGGVVTFVPDEYHTWSGGSHV